LIDKLLDGSVHSRALLANTIFYIVPFTNPDGVYGGLSRSASTGVNIEINWDRPDPLTMPEVKALRGKIESLTKEKPFDLFLNMHSQISGTITYWIHTAESTSGLMFRKQMLLSALTINDNSWFAPADLSFSDVAPRYVEGWIWNRFGNNTVAVTFETPYTYYKDNKNGEWVSLDNLKSLANNSLFAISDYLGVSSDARILADVKVSRPSVWKKSAKDSLVYFGEECLITNKVKQKVSAKVAFPDAGTYKVYTWVAGSVDNWSDNLVNRWKEVGSVTVSKKRTYKWRGTSDQLNGVADKLLFLK
jgi:Zinc carboxypeptidase.